MLTRDLYFKAFVTQELETIRFSYSHMDLYGIVRVDYIDINFNNDHELNIKRLEEIEKITYGFMFWNNSDKGISFWNENPKLWHLGSADAD